MERLDVDPEDRGRPGLVIAGEFEGLENEGLLGFVDGDAEGQRHRGDTALHVMGIRYVYELVALEPRDLRVRQNFGTKSLREVTQKLATLGLTLGMTLEDHAYRAAVVATAAAIRTTKG